MFKHIRNPHFYYEYDEVRDYFIAAMVFGFILSFNDWGVESFNLFTGLWHWLLSILVVLVSLFIHDAGYRLSAISRGYKAKFEIWWFGILISLLVCFLSNGSLKVFIAGGVMLAIVKLQRLGKFPYHYSIWHEGYISLMGPLFSVAFAGIAKLLSAIIPMNSYILNNLIFFNVLYAVYSMLPIPPLAGFKVIWYSRLLYAFWFGFIVGFMVLALFNIFSIVLPLIIGFASFLAFYFYVENE